MTSQPHSGLANTVVTIATGALALGLYAALRFPASVAASPTPFILSAVGLLGYVLVGLFARRAPARMMPATAASAPNNSRAQGGYDAYFGTYTVDDWAGTVTQRLVGALSAENVGLVLTRSMIVDGDTLTIALATAAADGESITRTLVWRRAQPI